MFPVGAIERFAAERGVEVAWPEDYVLEPWYFDRKRLLDEQTRRFDIRTNPCVDFGRLEEKIPRCVLTPANDIQLVETLALLRDLRVPYRVRGAGHSSGGQTLIDQGAVLSTRKLSFVAPVGEVVTAGAGTFWIDIVKALAPRRPLVLTDNLRSTVGGTLAVGGFGDTSHRHGLQIDTIERIVLATADGLTRLSRGEPAFEAALADNGHKGVIAAATMRTMLAHKNLIARLFVWRSHEAFIQDAPMMSEVDFFRARKFWGENDRIEAIAGDFRSESNVVPPGARASPEYEVIEILETYERDPIAEWVHATPALELVVPLEDAGVFLRAIDVEPILPWLQHGASVAPVAPSRIPNAPTFLDRPAFLLALRPRMRPSEARAVLPHLLSITH